MTDELGLDTSRILEVLEAQKAEIEQQSATQKLATEACLRKASEFRKLRQAQDSCRKSEQKRIEKTEKHVAVHEEQTKYLMVMLDKLDRFLNTLEIKHKDFLNYQENLILVLSVMFTSQQHSMTEDSKNQVKSLLSALKKNVTNENHINVSKNDVTSAKDVNVNGNLNIEENSNG